MGFCIIMIIKQYLNTIGLLDELEDCRDEKEAISLLKRENLWGNVVDYPELEALKESYENGEIESDGNLSLSQLDKVAGGGRKGGGEKRTKHRNKKTDETKTPEITVFVGDSERSVPLTEENGILETKDKNTGEQHITFFSGRPRSEEEFLGDYDKFEIIPCTYDEETGKTIIRHKFIEKEFSDKDKRDYDIEGPGYLVRVEGEEEKEEENWEEDNILGRFFEIAEKQVPENVLTRATDEQQKTIKAPEAENDAELHNEEEGQEDTPVAEPEESKNEFEVYMDELSNEDANLTPSNILTKARLAYANAKTEGDSKELSAQLSRITEDLNCAVKEGLISESDSENITNICQFNANVCANIGQDFLASESWKNTIVIEEQSITLQESMGRDFGKVFSACLLDTIRMHENGKTAWGHQNENPRFLIEKTNAEDLVGSIISERSLDIFSCSKKERQKFVTNMQEIFKFIESICDKGFTLTHWQRKNDSTGIWETYALRKNERITLKLNKNSVLDSVRKNLSDNPLLKTIFDKFQGESIDWAEEGLWEDDNLERLFDVFKGDKSFSSDVNEGARTINLRKTGMDSKNPEQYLDERCKNIRYESISLLETQAILEAIHKKMRGETNALSQEEKCELFRLNDQTRTHRSQYFNEVKNMDNKDLNRLNELENRITEKAVNFSVVNKKTCTNINRVFKNAGLDKDLKQKTKDMYRGSCYILGLVFKTKNYRRAQLLAACQVAKEHNEKPIKYIQYLQQNNTDLVTAARFYEGENRVVLAAKNILNNDRYEEERRKRIENLKTIDWVNSHQIPYSY